MVKIPCASEKETFHLPSVPVADISERTDNDDSSYPNNEKSFHPTKSPDNRSYLQSIIHRKGRFVARQRQIAVYYSQTLLLILIKNHIEAKIMRTVNKSVIATSIAALLMVSSGAWAAAAGTTATDAGSASGKVTVTGMIVKSACTVETPAGGYTVNLGDNISIGELMSTVGHSTLQTLTLKLTHCVLKADEAMSLPATKEADVTFSGDGGIDTAKDTLFKNSPISGEPAKHVGIGLFDSAGNTISATTLKTNPQSFPLNSSTADLTFKLAAVHDDASMVTPGSVGATLTYTITYK